ncbi:MAG: hypothetical protein WCA79_10040 [Anaerolineales bacterium]
MNAFLQEQKPKLGRSRKEIQSNVTDNQSAKMPTSHGVIQGYNAQALVDAKRQIILHAESFSRQDHETLAPMMAAAQKNMRTIGKDADYFNSKRLSADSNYFSLADLVLCQDQNLDAYIPDLQFRKRDERLSRQQRFKNGIHSRKRSKHKEDIFSSTDFVFDDTRQVYLCPQGHVLQRSARNQRNRYASMIFIALIKLIVPIVHWDESV